MPLSPAAPRELIHHREIHCHGYRRADGLWDVEAHLTDVKTYAFVNEWRGEVTPGTPIHDMWLRLTVDDHLVIHAVEAATDGSPYPVCGAVTPRFQRLVGLAINPGFQREVRKRLGGVEGCTHLLELLGPLATTCFQTVFPYRNRERPEGAREPKATGKRPRLIDTCHAFASDGEVVRRNWPEFYTGS